MIISNKHKGKYNNGLVIQLFITTVINIIFQEAIYVEGASFHHNKINNELFSS